MAVKTEFNQVLESTIDGVVVGRVKEDYFYKATDLQYYPIGSIYRKGDRAFRYARANVNSNSDLPITVAGVCSLEDQAINQRVAADAQIIGDKEVSVTITADDANSGVFSEDHLYGGYITVRESGTHNQTRLITGNDAQSGAGDIRIDVDIPWETAITAGDYCSAIFSPYHAVVRACTQDHQTRRPVVGIPVAPATDGQWFWIQTWGPIHMNCELAFHGVNIMQAVFDGGGGIIRHIETGVNRVEQHAGFIMNQAQAAAGQSYEPFLFLQIAP